MRSIRGATATLAALAAIVAAASVAAETPSRAVADVEKPKKVQHVDPLYPAEARAAGVEGVVLVGFTVDVAGRVTDPVVLSGHVLLDDAALAAVRQWRYRRPPPCASTAARSRTCRRSLSETSSPRPC
jgi:TonB family protein